MHGVARILRIHINWCIDHTIGIVQCERMYNTLCAKVCTPTETINAVIGSTDVPDMVK